MRSRMFRFIAIFILVLFSSFWANGSQYGVVLSAASKGYNEVFAAEKNLEVHYINVGHGDCILIKYPEGKIGLIDAGKESNSEAIVNYLKSEGIKKIDYLFISHYDEDHIGGILEIMDKFNIDKLYGPICKKELLVKNEVYSKMINKLDEKGIKIKYLKNGNEIKIDNTENIILAPIKKEYVYPNDYSIVIKLKYKNNVFLFTGDIQAEGQKEIVKKYGNELKCDVLKVPHHGYETGIGDEFLKIASPNVSIISNGNDDHAPLYSLKLYNDLVDNGSAVYSTYDYGTVIVVSDGDNINVILKDKSTSSINSN